MEKASFNFIFSLILLFSLPALQFSEAFVGSKDQIIVGPPRPCKSVANCGFCGVGFPICEHGVCKCVHFHRTPPADYKINGDSDDCPPGCRIPNCPGKGRGGGGKCCNC